MAGLPPEVCELLQGRNFVHVASVLPDGSPHSVPVWAALEDDRIVFFTQAGSRKARNVDRDPRLALSVVDYTNPYRNAQIRGRVVEVRRGEEAFETMDRISRQYTDADFPFRGPKTVVYVIEPERVRFVELPFEHRA